MPLSLIHIFKRYDGGETISSIMNWLNEQGLTNTRGQKMTFNSVGHILHNLSLIHICPESKPRGPRKPKMVKDKEDEHEKHQKL